MSESEEGRPTSDFVKKLYTILEDDSVKHIVCWGPEGDSFVIQDTNEFSKTVLPKMFKHSNFASFVRQLNKYDFHKVKSMADKAGEHSWTFRHAKFTRLNRDNAVDTIKRKATFPRKFIAGADLAWNSNHVEGTSCWGAFQLRASPEATSDSSRSASHDAPERCRVCRGQVGSEGADELRERVANLERDYRNLVEEYRRDMGHQQRLIQGLVAHLEETRGESQECKLAVPNSETIQDTKLQCELCSITDNGRTRAQHNRVGCGMPDFLVVPPVLGDSTEGWSSVASSVLSASSFDDDGGWYRFRGRVGRGQLSGTDEEMTEAEGRRGSPRIAFSAPPLTMSMNSGSAGQFEFGATLVPVNGTNYETTGPLDNRLPTSPCKPHTYEEQRMGRWDDWTFDTTSLLAASPMHRGLGIGRAGEPENHSGAISMGVS